MIVPPYMEHTEQSIKGIPFEYYVIGVDGISFQKAGEQTCVQVFCNFQRQSPDRGHIFSPRCSLR